MNGACGVPVTFCLLVITIFTPNVLGNESSGLSQSRGNYQWDQQTTRWNPAQLFRQPQCTPSNEESEDPHNQQYESMHDPNHYGRSVDGSSMRANAVPCQYHQQQSDGGYDASYDAHSQSKANPYNSQRYAYANAHSQPSEYASHSGAYQSDSPDHASSGDHSSDEPSNSPAGGYSYHQSPDDSGRQPAHGSTPRNPFLAYTQVMTPASHHHNSRMQNSFNDQQHGSDDQQSDDCNYIHAPNANQEYSQSRNDQRDHYSYE